MSHYYLTLKKSCFLLLKKSTVTLFGRINLLLFQTLESNQRRKDIYHALTANMAIIFDFFLRLIELHVSQFRALSETNEMKANANGRVVQVVLLTLTGFVEWVSMSHVLTQNGKLLQILCFLLNDVSFQYPASECLSQVIINFIVVI